MWDIDLSLMQFDYGQKVLSQWKEHLFPAWFTKAIFIYSYLQFKRFKKGNAKAYFSFTACLQAPKINGSH